MASSQQLAQATLATDLGETLPAAWESLNLAQLEQTMPDFVQQVQALVTHYGKASAALAIQSYAAERKAASVTGKFTVRPAAPANFDQVDSGVRWATKGLWSATPDVEAAKTKVYGVAQRDVLDTGRNTTMNAVKSDRKAQGWHRITEPGACSFCILLATREGTYRKNAFLESNLKFKGDGEFKTHDNCKCVMAPDFGPYEPSAELRRYQAIYSEVAAKSHGPVATRAAFRQAIESERSAPAPR